jgi:hypothetical protein
MPFCRAAPSMFSENLWYFVISIIWQNSLSRWVNELITVSNFSAIISSSCKYLQETCKIQMKVSAYIWTTGIKLIENKRLYLNRTKAAFILTLFSELEQTLERQVHLSKSLWWPHFLLLISYLHLQPIEERSEMLNGRKNTSSSLVTTKKKTLTSIKKI